MIFKFENMSDADFSSLRGCTLVDGSFDPLHNGHIEYFESARNLGLPVVCLLAPDSYTSTKHPILLESSLRSKVLHSLRQIDHVIWGDIPTANAISRIEPKIFFKGGDWKDKLPEDIIVACEQVDCKIQLGAMPIESSSGLLRKIINGEK